MCFEFGVRLHRFCFQSLYNIHIQPVLFIKAVSVTRALKHTKCVREREKEREKGTYDTIKKHLEQLTFDIASQFGWKHSARDGKQQPNTRLEESVSDPTIECWTMPIQIPCISSLFINLSNRCKSRPKTLEPIFLSLTFRAVSLFTASAQRSANRSTNAAVYPVLFFMCAFTRTYETIFNSNS